MDAHRVGFITGVFVGLGVAAVYWHRKRRYWVRNILGFLCLLGFGLIGFAILSAPSDAEAAATVDRGLRAGCEAGCAREGGAPDLCTAYCRCVLDELHAKHSDQELNDLVVAASRNGSAEAMAVINAPAATCIERIR